jgi:hypothetical protein
MRLVKAWLPGLASQIRVPAARQRSPQLIALPRWYLVTGLT